MVCLKAEEWLYSKLRREERRGRLLTPNSGKHLRSAWNSGQCGAEHSEAITGDGLTGEGPSGGGSGKSSERALLY